MIKTIEVWSLNIISGGHWYVFRAGNIAAPLNCSLGTYFYDKDPECLNAWLGSGTWCNAYLTIEIELPIDPSGYACYSMVYGDKFVEVLKDVQEKVRSSSGIL